MCICQGNIKQENNLNIHVNIIPKRENYQYICLTDRQNTSLQVLVQILFRLNNVAYLYLSD